MKLFENGPTLNERNKYEKFGYDILILKFLEGNSLGFLYVNDISH